ncbi:hypothetical protein FACS1894188_10550 [Clostridia bacterium]|nr:hypothetical protein FACS1894188_10550 [Clostridia bacterium]
MGSKYPVMKSSEIIKILKKMGFVFKYQKGSHARYVKVGEKTKTVTIPMHNEVDKGTLQSILEQAEISLEEFLEQR